jgi:hypothetical protein
VPVGVLDVFKHLFAQCPLADRLEPLLEFGKICIPGEPGKLRAKTLEVAKGEFVDDADEPVKFKKGVLQRCGREKRFLERENGLFYRLADLVVGLIYVAEPVRFIDDHQVPGRLANVRLPGAGELVRANHNAVALKGIQVPGADRLIECAGLKNGGGQEELVGEFLAPLLAEVRGTYYQEAVFALGPLLGEQDASLDRLSQADLIGEDCSLRERRAKSKQRRLDLVRVQVNLCIG